MDIQLKISGFSGEKEDWERWYITFLAKARLRGYRDIFVGIEVATTKGTKGFEEFQAKNDVAYAELLISCESDLCMGIVHVSRTEMMPEGDVGLAWKNLVAKYEPTTKANLILLKKQFNNCRLEDASKDSDQWIQELEIMKRKLEILGKKLSEMDVIIHVLHNLPSEYETTIEILETELERDEATLERVKEKLRARFEKIQKANPPKDRALFANDQFKRYKGNCSFCGIYGHKGSECRKRSKGKRFENNRNGNQNFNRNGQDPNKSFVGMCYLCKQKGHKVEDCPNNNLKGTDQVNLSHDEIVLIGSDQEMSQKDMWIGDSGATSHMVCHDVGMFGCKPSNQQVIVGDGRSVKVLKTGNLKVIFQKRKGEKNEVLLEDVKFIPSLKVNLFSILVALKKGATVRSEGTSLIIKKGQKELHFDHKIPMGSSFLMGAKVKNVGEGCLVVSEAKEMKLEKFHKLLGHASLETTKQTAKRLNLKLIGNFKQCEDCILAKIKRKNLNKESQNKSRIPGERILIDVSYIKRESLGKRNMWILIEDQASTMKWSHFGRRKNESINIVFNFIQQLKAKSPNLGKYLRMDNSGENVVLKNKLHKEGVDTVVEFTSPNTPEQNGQVERSFATLWGRVRAMLNNSGVDAELRAELWAECAATATKLNNMLSKKGGKSPYELFHGKECKFAKKLKLFGEIGIKIARSSNLKEKIANKGDKCIFIGYEDEHPGNTYRVLDLRTKTVMISRDVRWLGKTYGELFKNKIVKKFMDTDLGSSEEESEDEIILKIRKGNEEEVPEPKQKVIPTSSIITRSKALMDAVEDDSSSSESEEGGFIMEEPPGDPTNFDKAWNNPSEVKRMKWREAVMKEIQSMDKCGV